MPKIKTHMVSENSDLLTACSHQLLKKKNVCTKFGCEINS